MSEYQYYEFQAIDHPLSERQMGELRAVSSRATITPTSFTNFYNFGDFKGDPSVWMEKYFDAFLYLANWGTRILMFRLPRRSLEIKTAKLYCDGEAASVRVKGEFTILEFRSEDEGGDWEHDGQGWLPSIVPVRADIAGGDHRALYLAWLIGVQKGNFEEDATEPPCPPGLIDLTGPMDKFADFLRIDRKLIAGAGAGSAARKELRRRLEASIPRPAAPR